MLQTNVDLDSKVSEVSKRVFLGTLFVAQSTTQSGPHENVLDSTAPIQYKRNIHFKVLF